MSASTSAPTHRPQSQLPWFAAWTAVGVGFAFGVTALAPLAVPVALLATVLLIVLHHADRSAFGILVGMGLLSLFVAYVQRKGPGTVSWHTATASGSDQYLDPRPWLIAGILLVAVGVVAFLLRQRGLRRDPR